MHGLLALAIGTTVVMAPYASAETLDSALSRAYENNPAIRAAVAAVRASAEAFPQARAGYLPSIAIQGQTQGYREGVRTASKTQHSTQPKQVNYTGISETNTELLLNLTQTLYDGGKTGAKMDIARSQAAAALAQLDGAVAQVFQGLTEAYLDLQSLSSLIALNDDIIKQYSQLEAQADSLFRKRLGTLTDVAQAQTAKASAAAQRTTLEASLEAARSRYAALSGRPPDAPSAWPVLPALPTDFDAAKTLAQDLNPTLRIARCNVDSARSGITVAKSAALPNAQLGLVLSTDRNPTWNATQGQRYYQSTDTNTAEAWLTVSMPLFSGGAIRSQVRQAYANMNANAFTLDDTYNQLVGTLESEWAALQLARERKGLVAIEVTAAQQTVDGFIRQFNNGLSTMKDVIDTRQKLDLAKQQQITVRGTILATQAKLLGVIGRLTPQDFSLHIKPHEAEAYVQAVRHGILGPALP